MNTGTSSFSSTVQQMTEMSHQQNPNLKFATCADYIRPLLSNR